MGFRFRKSIKFGGVRINLSKSGIGYSVGTKGARITKTAKGTTRTTLSIPGTGISYVKETSGKSGTSSRADGYANRDAATSRTDDMCREEGGVKAKNSFLSIIKKVLLWALAIVVALSGMVYMPSVHSAVALILAALLLPVAKWQEMLRKVINGKLKVILAVVLAAAWMVTLGVVADNSGDAVPASDPEVVPFNVPGQTLIPMFGTEPTAMPTNQPTATPTEVPVQEPTATPTAKPTDAPTATPVPVLKEGSEGEPVKEMQLRLIQLGYLDGAADGDFGPATKQAVKAFQKKNGLTDDGVAGEKTLTLLYSDQAVKQVWVYVPASGSGKYHRDSDCSGMSDPKKMTYEEAVSKGLDACGKCY